MRPADYDDMDPYGFDEPSVPENKTPLFAHECVGMELYEDDGAPDAHGEEHHSDDYEEDRRPSTVYDDEEDIDLNDPTLEKFPSNRDEIIDTVRKLEGGLNEDHADVEGLIPLSPVVGPSGPQNHDLVGDLIVSSPVVASPVVARGSRMLNLPRSSLGSVSSDRSSAISLGSISEAEEVGVEDAVDEAEEADEPPVISTPKPRRDSSRGDAAAPTSDDDEGIAMRRSDKDKSPEASSNEATQVPTPSAEAPTGMSVTDAQNEEGQDAPNGQPEVKSVPASEQSASQTSGSPGQASGESGSPRIVIQSAEEAEQVEGSTDEPATERSAPDSAKTTGVDTGAHSQVKRRNAGPDRIATPVSINEAGIQAAKSGGWIRSFFRMIFVDWIGGFIRRLCGGKQRET